MSENAANSPPRLLEKEVPAGKSRENRVALSVHVS